MFHITRKTFPDRLLTAADLSAAADLWRQWYLLSKRMGERGTVQLSARVYGFARTDAASIQAQLPGSTLVDPDTLEVTGPATPADGGIDTSAWVRTLAVTAGRPLVVRLYAAVVGSSPLAPNEPGSDNTLLLTGRPQTDGLLLKAAMRLGSTGTDEEMFRRMPWPAEAKFLAALDQFQASGDAKAAKASLGADAKTLIVPRDLERKIRRVTRMVGEVSGEHSPLSLLKRMALPIAMAGLARMIWVRKPDLWPAAAAAAGLAALMAGHVLYTKAKRITRFHKAMNTGLAKVYAKTPTFAKVDLASTGFADGPNLVKFTSDILALGAVHCYDFRITSMEGSQSVHRVFHLPAERTILTLMLMSKTQDFHLFPARAVVSARTYYDGGATVSTQVNKDAYRKPVNTASPLRYLPEDTDPATLLTRHREHVRRAASGREPLAVDPENLFALETAEHHKLLELNKARRCYYTWSDALHQGFEVPRRALTM